MKIIRAYVFFVVALLLGHVLFVWLVDARKDFATGVIRPLVMDSRSEKTLLYAKAAAESPVTGILLGSSRTLTFQPADLDKETGLHFFNFAVQSARAEDHLAIYRWLCAQNKAPKQLVIGYDVELLHDGDPIDARLQQNGALWRQLHPDASEPSKIGRFISTMTSEHGVSPATLFSASYLMDSARSLWLLAIHAQRITDLASDGTVRWQNWIAERRAGTFKLATRISDTKTEYSARYNRMHGLSAERQRVFADLLREAKDHDTHVTICLLPLHPDLHAYVTAKCNYDQLLRQTVAFLQEQSGRYGCDLIDCTDANRLGLAPDEWFDGAHVTESNAARLVHYALAAAPTPGK